VAAQLRRELGVPVEERGGRYGEFTVLVGDQEVVTAGSLGWLGVLPSAEEVIAKVRARVG